MQRNWSFPGINISVLVCLSIGIYQIDSSIYLPQISQFSEFNCNLQEKDFNNKNCLQEKMHILLKQNDTMLFWVDDY